MVPLWKDPFLQRPPINKDRFFPASKPFITHKPPLLGRPPLYKDHFCWTSAAVFIDGDHCITINPHFVTATRRLDGVYLTGYILVQDILVVVEDVSHTDEGHAHVLTVVILIVRLTHHRELDSENTANLPP